uniref:DNA replication licensing factor MCM7 (Trinotate prediction) n=1 Tax=Myxobolus squamalis TaxID=59785 RepID=A0A6B2FZY2_MYXSQ
MEQQTVSIAKAGISTTLNARVSILAAANPAYGRYNPKKTIDQNIQLPAALLSRFDLIWVIRDRPSRQDDLKLAEHITYVHQHNGPPPTQTTPFSIALLRSFVMRCKGVNPVIPADLKDFIVASYVEMRKESRVETDCTYTSARTLLSILRLSTSLARLRFGKTVHKNDVKEAIRLMDCSKASVGHGDLHSKTSRPHDVIFGVIREMAQSLSSKTIDYEQVRQQCIAKGFKMDQFLKCISDYQDLNVLHVNNSQTHIILV